MNATLVWIFTAKKGDKKMEKMKNNVSSFSFRSTDIKFPNKNYIFSYRTNENFFNEARKNIRLC